METRFAFFFDPAARAVVDWARERTFEGHPVAGHTQPKARVVLAVAASALASRIGTFLTCPIRRRSEFLAASRRRSAIATRSSQKDGHVWSTAIHVGVDHGVAGERVGGDDPSRAFLGSPIGAPGVKRG